MSNEFSVPESKPRPALVSFAAYAQFAVFVVAVLGLIASLVQLIPMFGEFETKLSQQDIAAEDKDLLLTSLQLGMVMVYVIVSLMPALALVTAIMGFFVLRGSNGARITTWVFAGIGLACNGCGMLAMPFGGDPGTFEVSNDSQNPEIDKAMQEMINDLEVPVWTEIVGVVTTILMVLLFLAIIILLAMPKSNDYFRKAPQQPPYPPQPPAAFPPQ